MYSASDISPFAAACESWPRAASFSQNFCAIVFPVDQPNSVSCQVPPIFNARRDLSFADHAAPLVTHNVNREGAYRPAERGKNRLSKKRSFRLGNPYAVACDAP